MIGCIGDDVIDDRVPEMVLITNLIDTLQVGDIYQFNARYFDNIGREKVANVIWSSSDPTIITVNNTGEVKGIAEGIADVIAAVEGIEGRIENKIAIVVSESETSIVQEIRVGEIKTTSSYVLEGNFELVQNRNDLVLTLLDDFRTTEALPGLYVYLGNNPSSISNAFEIGPITQFSGRHSYTISNIDLFQYQYVLFWCKPFGVKVGEGIFSE